MSQISIQTLDFLKALKENNNRPWFTEHKDRYETAKSEMVAFADELLNKVNKFDVIETPSGAKSLYRIYRDVRFSKDKSPYKQHFSGSFRRAGANRRGGLYFHIEPNASMLGGGFWKPSKEDLLHVRKQIAADAQPLREVVESKAFKDYFGTLDGDQLKTAPKSFAKDHPNIDLLRYKSFIVSRTFTDEEVLAPDFVDIVADGLHKMYPFFNCMTEYLTTDLNGESIID